MLDCEGVGRVRATPPIPASDFGLRHVRGAEVIEIRDGEGTYLKEFRSRARRDEAEPKQVRPHSEASSPCALDAAQYQMDTAREQEGKAWTCTVD